MEIKNELEAIEQIEKAFIALAKQVQEVRKAQKNYFNSRTLKNLNLAKKLEKELDITCKIIRETHLMSQKRRVSPTLFNTTVCPNKTKGL